MAKNTESLILRSTTHSPLTTKGSELTQTDHDNNLINIWKDFVALSYTADVTAYDAGTTYDDTDNRYATYNGKTWKWINASPGSGQTPADGVYWSEVFPTDMAHIKNQDTYLDKGGANEVSAATIKAGLAVADATTDLSLTKKTDEGFTIASSTGDDVDIPSATESYAGLLPAAMYQVLLQTSGSNSGDQTLEDLNAEDLDNKVTTLDDSTYNDDAYPSSKAVQDYVSSYVQQETIGVICSEIGKDLAVKATAGYFFIRYDATIVDIAIDMITAPTGAAVQVDILVNGVSILGTDYLTIDAGETSSDTSAVTAVLTSTTLDKGDKVTFDIKQVGSTVAGQDLQCSMLIKQR